MKKNQESNEREKEEEAKTKNYYETILHFYKCLCFACSCLLRRENVRETRGNYKKKLEDYFSIFNYGRQNGILGRTPGSCILLHTTTKNLPHYGVQLANIDRIVTERETEPWYHVWQSVANIFFWTEYEYEYIRNILLKTNTNTNIFGINFWTEYEYEYIRDNQVDRIRIFEYFGLEYSNILGLNIRILFDQYSNIP